MLIHWKSLNLRQFAATLLAFIALGTTAIFASDAAHSEEKEPLDVTGMIMHHIADAHEFHIYGEGETSVTMPLPIILWTNNGLVTFLSSEFHHSDNGSVVVEKNGQRFVKFHEKIYYASEMADSHGAFVELDEKHHALNDRPLDFSITKNVFSLLLSAIILILLFGSAAKAYRKSSNGVPTGLASFLEPIILFVRDDIAIPNIGEKHYKRFMPYLLTIFFFIWVNNLIGLVPFFPGSANLTGNIAVTLVLALITFIITTINGNKDYWGHIFATPGVPVPLLVIMIPVEIIGMFTKPFALMIRLFANITAGHIIILSLVSLIFIFETAMASLVSVPFVLFMNVMELLVAALQAFIFTLLSALFIGGAVAEHEHH